MYSLYFHVLSPIGLPQGLLNIDNKSNSSWDLCKSFINPARAHIISEAQHTFDKERLSPAISAQTMSVCFHILFYKSGTGTSSMYYTENFMENFM